MEWKFEQAPGVACITCKSVTEGHPVLVVTHYEDDHSWAFLDGEPLDVEAAMVVAMSTVINLHPELVEIADLPPGWSANRVTSDMPWEKEPDDFVVED